jgi:hypothetical protein
MLADGISLNAIVKYSEISLDEIRSLDD